jgi:hypothetical protein
LRRAQGDDRPEAEGAFGQADVEVAVGTTTRVAVTKAGTTWVVRSATPDHGDLDIRLPEGTFGLGSIVTQGTAQGRAIDVAGARSPGAVTMTFAGGSAPAATLSGGLVAVSIPRSVGRIGHRGWAIRGDECARRDHVQRGDLANRSTELTMNAMATSSTGVTYGP